MKIIEPFMAGLALLLCSCGVQVAPTTDPLGAYNQYGGGRRDNDRSGYGSVRVSSLSPIFFKELSGGLVTPPLPVSNDQTIILLQNGLLAGVRLDSVNWTRQLGPQFPGIAADSSGQIYTVSVRGELNAIHPDGTIAWKAPLRPPGDSAAIVNYSWPLALAAGVVVGSTGGKVVRMRGDGKLLWEVMRGGAIMQSIAADPGLGIVIGVTHNDYALSDSLALLDPASGLQRWSAAVEGGRIVSGPAILGELLVVGVASAAEDGSRTPYVAAFTPQGKLAWRTPLPVMPRGLAGDLEGNVYVGGSAVRRDFAGGAVVSLDRSGKERWRVTLQSGVPAAPVVSRDWVYFVSRQDERTGVFTYGRDGKFSAFVPISTLPDVLPQPVLTPYGQVLLGGIGEPVLLRGSD
jgi:outer membrane protein assembly factor BamB